MTVITSNANFDPRDALLNDATALQAMYAEFAHEDRQLVMMGMASYAGLLGEEEHGEKVEQQLPDGK